MSERFGPNTPAVEALIARIATLTDAEINALGAQSPSMDQWVATWDVAWEAATPAAREAALSELRPLMGSAFDAACAATLGLMVRDLISPGHFATLTRRWREVIGPELVT